jgi:hypothetical protein
LDYDPRAAKMASPTLSASFHIVRIDHRNKRFIIGLALSCVIEQKDRPYDIEHLAPHAVEAATSLLFTDF